MCIATLSECERAKNRKHHMAKYQCASHSFRHEFSRNDNRKKETITTTTNHRLIQIHFNDYNFVASVVKLFRIQNIMQEKGERMHKNRRIMHVFQMNA